MKTTFLIAPVLALLLVLGCASKGKTDIEPYPGGSMLPSGGNSEKVEGTLYRIRQSTADGPNTVAEFFRKQLVAGKGWTETDRGIGTSFGDGNMTVNSVLSLQDEATIFPTDLSKPAGFVIVYESNNTTYAHIFRYLPKAAK